MQLGEESIVIRRPIDEVFRFVADVGNDPSWHTTVVESWRTSPEPIGLGATFAGIYDSHKDTLETPAQPGNFQHLRAAIIEYVQDEALRIHVEFTGRPVAWARVRLGANLT